MLDIFSEKYYFSLLRIFLNNGVYYMAKKQIVRMTHQREIILEELRQLKSHPTADELYSIIKKRLPRISLATVYRNLDILADNGHIQRIELGGRQRRFDGNPMPHYHIRCNVCGKIADVEIYDSDIKEKIEVDIDLSKVDACGFRILGYKFEFEGLCPDCYIEIEEN